MTEFISCLSDLMHQEGVASLVGLLLGFYFILVFAFVERFGLKVFLVGLGILLFLLGLVLLLIR